MKLKEYDIAEHLNSEEEMQLYLNKILEDGDPALVLSALGDIARVRKMSQLSREGGCQEKGFIMPCQEKEILHSSPCLKSQKC